MKRRLLNTSRVISRALNADEQGAQSVAMQIVAIGFIISAIQDSAETALNSSTDVLLTAAACMAQAQDSAS